MFRPTTTTVHTNSSWIPFQAIVACVLATLALANASAVNAAEKIDDNDLLKAIETELRVEPLLSTASVNVEVDEGIVKLTGTVPTLLAERRALHLVGNLKGVRSIVESVIVVSPGGNDQQIQTNVRRALSDDSVTESYEITTSVDSGEVLLDGEVDSYAERQMAEVVAAAVRGVVSIDNQIKVDPKSQRSDSEIKADVKSRLELSPNVSDSTIAVHVEDGHVKLTGSVGSYNERQNASLLAWVSGVSDVSVQELEVIWWLEKERRRDKFTVVRNDAQIRQAVEDALIYDPRVKNSKIEVRVLNGAVSLIGKVNSLTAKRSAADDARNTLGVRKVINNLKVEIADWPGDEIVTQRVEAALERDAILSRHPLDASSHFGTVHLHGRVKQSFEKQRAGSLVANVRGVKKVNNRITVTSPWSEKPDLHIRRDLQRRLRWSPNLQQEQLRHDVDDGVVTLEGKVDTWRQRRAVEDHAYQAGARKVINKLKFPALTTQ